MSTRFLLRVLLVLFVTPISQASGQVLFDDEDKVEEKPDPPKRERTRAREKEKEREEEPDAKTCESGKVANEFTRFHCCWPGQAWNGEACVGLPTSCPVGFDLHVPSQSCAIQCPEGRTSTIDGAHCCWPGQAWNGSSCVGLPLSCPAGLLPSAERQACVKDCPDGKVVSNDHCCWPGQVFTDNACRGVPSACPEGHRADGEACVRDQDQDQDQDGIADASDRCPHRPEDMDGFEDEDGCLDPDNDGDGICDAQLNLTAAALAELGCRGSDACPLDAEDSDGFEDEDGCPEKASAETIAVEAPPEGDVDGGDGGSDAAAWTTLLAGVGVAAGGAALLAYGTTEKDALKALVADGRSSGETITSTTQAAVEDDFQTANTMTVAGGVLLGVGAAAAITGVVLFFVGDEETPVETTVSGSLGRDHVLIGLQGRF